MTNENGCNGIWMGIELLKKDIDGLREKIDSPRKRGLYDNVAFVISVGAFVLSVLSTVYSYYNSNVTKLSSYRSELQSVLRNHVMMKKDSLDVSLNHKGDEVYMTEYIPIYRTATLVAARRAFDLAEKIDEIDRDSITSVELFAIADMLKSADDTTALFVLDKARHKTNNVMEYVSIQRDAGDLCFFMNNLDGGRGRYNDAIRYVDENMKGEFGTVGLFYNAYTMIRLACAEFGVGNKARGFSCLAKAEGYLRDVPEGVSLNQIRDQIFRIRAMYGGGQ